jgi:hypothetical protein
VNALAAGQHREGLQAHIGEMILEVAGGLPDMLEASPSSGSISNTRRSGFSTSEVDEPQPWNSIVPIWTQLIRPAWSLT